MKELSEQENIMAVAMNCVRKGMPLPSDIRWQLTDEQRMELRNYHLLLADFNNESEHNPPNNAS